MCGRRPQETGFPSPHARVWNVIGNRTETLVESDAVPAAGKGLVMKSSLGLIDIVIGVSAGC